MFKRNQIVYAKSQDYGNCIIQLIHRITKNVKGEVMKSPIWYAYVFDSDKDRDFVEFLLNTKGFSKFVGFFEDFDKHNFMEVLE